MLHQQRSSLRLATRMAHKSILGSTQTVTGGYFSTAATATTALHNNVKRLMIKYETAPSDLFQITKASKVVLREYGAQEKLGRKAYDFVISDDGDILPSTGTYFKRPNGMSLRPLGSNMWEILSLFQGSVYVNIIPEGTVIPPDLVLYLERGDHFSLQTSKVCTPKELNLRLTEFMSKMERITKEEYYKRYPMEAEADADIDTVTK